MSDKDDEIKSYTLTFPIHLFSDYMFMAIDECTKVISNSTPQDLNDASNLISVQIPIPNNKNNLFHEIARADRSFFADDSRNARIYKILRNATNKLQGQAIRDRYNIAYEDDPLDSVKFNRAISHLIITGMAEKVSRGVYKYRKIEGFNAKDRLHLLLNENEENALSKLKEILPELEMIDNISPEKKKKIQKANEVLENLQQKLKWQKAKK